MISAQLPRACHPLTGQYHRLLAEPVIHRVECFHQGRGALWSVKERPWPVIQREKVIQHHARLGEGVAADLWPSGQGAAFRGSNQCECV